MDSIRVSSSPINSLCHIPYSPEVILGCENVKVLNTISGNLSEFPSAHHSPTTSLDVKNNSLISSNANTITHWDFQKQKVLQTMRSMNEGTNDMINDLKFANERVIVSGGDNCFINLFDLRTSKNIYSLKVANDNINKIEVKNGIIYLTSNDGYFSHVDLRNEEIVKFKYNHAIIDFSLFENKAINLFESGSITIVDLKEKTLLNEYTVSKAFKYMIKMDFQLNQLVLGSEQGRILHYLYNSKVNMITKQDGFSTPSPMITHVKILDGIIIGVGNDGLLHRFNIETR